MSIKDTFHRKPSLSYDCPHCKERLKSPLMNAGTEDTCPYCHQLFTVPGEKKKQEYEVKRAFVQAAKQKAAGTRLAVQRAEDQRIREQQESDEKQALAQQKAASDAFKKAVPAGWPPIVMAVVGGLIFFFFAFLYDTSISSGSSRVNNLGLLQNRLVGCITGVVLFVGGIAIHSITRAMAKIHKDES